MKSSEEQLLKVRKAQTLSGAEKIAVPAAGKQRTGVLETPGFTVPESFFEPLPEEELRLWNGEGE